MNDTARIILAGHTGLQKKEAARRLEILLVSLRDEWVNRTKVVFLEECIERAGGGDTRLLAEATNYQVQRSRWFAGWQEAREELDGSGALCQILVAHLSFATRSVRSCPADFAALAKWRPHFIVTLIDDVYSVKRRIELKQFSFTLAQLYAWRSTEQMLADKLGVLTGIMENPDHNTLAHAYCESLTVAAKTPAISVARLLARHDSPRVYASYPISTTRGHPRLKKEINNFRQSLHKIMPTFDPLTIEELPLLNWYQPKKQQVGFDPRRGPPRHKDDEGKKRWDCRVGDDDYAPLVWEPETCEDAAGEPKDFFPVIISRPEFEQLLLPGHGRDHTLVDDQLEVRDLRLVAQADFVVCWRPCLGGRMSGGVNREIVEANQLQKEIVAFVGNDKEPGGVLKGKITHSFKDEAAFWRFLEQRAARPVNLPRRAYY